MTPSTSAVSPLRQRMLDDMRMRKLADNTQVAYVTYNGFTSLSPATTRTKHIFKTTDNGTNWTDVSGLAGGGPANYPDLPTHSVVIDPGTSPHSIIVSNDAFDARPACFMHTLPSREMMAVTGIPNIGPYASCTSS